MAGEGMADDLGEEAYERQEYRLEQLEHILDVIRQWTSRHKAADLFELAQAMGFPWAPVYSPRNVLKSPQLKDRGFFVTTDQKESGRRMEFPGSPYRFSSVPPVHWKRAPLAGEHNHLVYREELGLAEDELQRLSSSGVI
jgi:crotonobetainyl-CoA:carnitine CoA-transferase CaiB-like acyl-CoA transferase